MHDILAGRDVTIINVPPAAAIPRISLLDSVRTPLEKPKPNAGLSDSGTPFALPAYLISPDPFPLLPIELSKFWGMNRGQFLGVMLTSQPKRIYEGLAKMEGGLYDVWNNNSKIPQPYRPRWWLTVRLGSQPNGIREPAQLATCIWEDNFAGYLENEGLPEEVLLGLIVVKPVDELSQIRIKDWEATILNSEFRRHQTALLVIAAGTPTSKSLKRVKEFADDCAEQLRGFPIAALYTPPSLQPKTTSHVLLNKQIDISSWKRQSMRYLANSELQMPPCLLSFIEKHVPETQTAFSIQDLIDLLERFNGAAVCVDELAQFMEAYYLDLLPALFYGLSRSSYQYHVLQLLSKSSFADGLIDTCVDAWLQGMEITNYRDFDSASSDVFTCDLLALGMMRQLRARRRGEADTLWRLLQPKLSSEMRHICNWFTQEVHETDFFAKSSSAILQLIARTGITEAIPVNILRHAALDETDIWRASLALPPSTNENRELIEKCEPKQRAVFGLLTSQEWHEMQDKQLLEQITACRRGFTLLFADISVV